MSQMGNHVDHQPTSPPLPLAIPKPASSDEIELARVARKRLESNQKRYSPEEKQAFLANLANSRKDQ